MKLKIISGGCLENTSDHKDKITVPRPNDDVFDLRFDFEMEI